MIKMHENEQADLDSIIAGYLAGNAVAEDIKLLNDWVESSDINKKYFDELKNIWEVSSKKINPGKINIEIALSNVLEKTSGKSKITTVWIYWKKIAAVVLIPLLLGNLIWFYLNSQKRNYASESVYNEVFAVYGTRTAINLADGSSVWLNSGSSLKYPEKFKGKERDVYLQGEAYFEIATNSSVPFIVKTPSLIVRATGTVFNVSDHISDMNSEVTLVTGKVFVNEISADKITEQFVELFPNQHLTLNKETGKISINKEDVNEYISWKDGKLIFRNKPLSYVVNKISQLFNVDIELHGSVLQDYRYRATFEDESLSEILRLLKISSPIDYVEVKRIPLPDGSFPKRKVMIFPSDSADMY